MKLLLAVLALAVLPAPAEPRLAPADLITLYTQFEQAPPPVVMDAIQDELARIMSPLGMRFEWLSLKGSAGHVSADLAVVGFRGRCNASNLEPLASDPGALGWTQVTDGVVLPFSDVDCDGIRSFVQSGLLRMDKADRDEAYGRAIGRVLAHELYHVFANTERHASTGVAKATYTVTELLAPVFRFGERQAQGLRLPTPAAPVGMALRR